MASFVDKLIDFTKESETPTSFWKWGSYAILAAALRDNVYWTARGHKICPNIFVLLNADSGAHRKSGPIKEADALLTPLAVTKFIRGRGSIQAILEDLATPTTDKTTGRQIRGGSCILVADELKSFFVSDDQLIGIMTDIYDFRPSFDYKLRGAPFKVNDLCVSMLAASNDEFLQSIYTAEAINGGLLARTFLVKADEMRPGNSLLEVEEEIESNKIKYSPKPLIDFLRDASSLKGKVRFEADAKLAYDAWYLPLRESYAKKPDKTGVMPRIHTGVIKIAVILAISKRLDLVVKKEDIEEAISECVSLLPNYDGFTFQAGKSTEAVAGQIFLNELWMQGGTLKRADFLTKYWFEVNHETLDKLIVTLDGAGMVQVGYSSSGFVYSMTEKCKNFYSKRVQ